MLTWCHRAARCHSHPLTAIAPVAAAPLLQAPLWLFMKDLCVSAETEGVVAAAVDSAGGKKP